VDHWRYRYPLPKVDMMSHVNLQLL